MCISFFFSWTISWIKSMTMKNCFFTTSATSPTSPVSPNAAFKTTLPKSLFVFHVHNVAS
ncbi:hypothetical protein BMB171_C2170 [Bacillus thuringiensis BMB171]|nr:hypothetical protein BMB171_C2170 [Bacillus thuringiensis BMB171]